MGKKLALVVLLSLVMLRLCCPRTQLTHFKVEGNSLAKSQTSSGRVVISNDADFATQGWPGAGTEADPYRIGGLQFGEGLRPFIDIQNVTASFVIENCETDTGTAWVSDPDHFSIRNATRFLITNCTFEGYGQHIDARYSQSISVVDCSFYDGSAGFLFHIDTVYFASNHVQRCHGLLTAQGCSQLTISGNTFLNEPYFYEGPVLPASLRIYQAVGMDFVENTVIGDFYTTNEAREVNVTGNTVHDAIEGFTVPWTSGYPVDRIDLLEVRENHFYKSGLRFPSYFSYERVLEIGVFENNTVNGKELLLLRDLSGGEVECSLYGQIVSYNCTGTRYVGGAFQNTSCGIFVADSTILDFVDIDIYNCYTGLQVYNSQGIVMSGIDSENSHCGVDMTQVVNASLVSSELNNGWTGLDMSWCSNVTIGSVVFAGNSYRGLDIHECNWCTVEYCTFDSNAQNVYESGYGPSIWDWNAWSDYFGIGPYIVSVHDGHTNADHHPSSTLPWYMLPVVWFLAYASLGFFLFMVMYIGSRSRKGRFARMVHTLDNQLLALMVLEILATPMILIIGMGGWYSPELYWATGSVLFRVWGQAGWIYGQGPIAHYPVPIYTSGIITVGQMLTIVLILILTGNAWRIARESADRISRRNNLIWLILVVVFLAGSTYPTLYQPWFETLRIPVPIGPILVYLTAKHVKQAPVTTPEPAKSVWWLKCPHCAAIYAYDERKGTKEGAVRCQNCGRAFGPELDKGSSDPSS